MRITRNIALLLPLLACACRATRPEVPERSTQVLPLHFAEDGGAGAERDDRAWWRDFGDERMDELVREALLGNRSLRVASERVAAADALAREIGAARAPQLSAELSGSRSRQNIIGVIPGVPLLTTYSTSYGLGATVSWDADLWGRLSAAESAARNDVAASEWDLEGAAQSLAARVVKAWLAVLEAEQQLEIAERAARNRESGRKSVEQWFDVGRRSAYDVESARTEEHTARANVEVARTNLANARRVLERLLGRYPSGAFVGGAVLPAVPPSPAPGLPAELLDRRPDLRAARARLESAADRSASARADRYPRLALTASGGTRSNELADLLDGDFRVWSVAGNLLQPIFDGGRLRARVDGADAEFRARAEEFADLVLSACAEVEGLLSAERHLAAREHELAEAARSAAEAEKRAEERYAQGQLELAALLLAQRTALAVQSERVSVRRMRLDARVDLHLALGGTLASAPLAPWLDGPPYRTENQSGEHSDQLDRRGPRRPAAPPTPRRRDRARRIGRPAGVPPTRERAVPEERDLARADRRGRRRRARRRPGARARRFFEPASASN
ncbi:MAG: TolC family protein [Planctomycetota bacterium]